MSKTYNVINHEFDVVVVGQGVAGTMLAFHLNKMGAKVLIIDSDHEKLIEKYLDQGKPKSQSPKKEAISPRFLGDYVRDADFLIDDSAISRTHIILYQDDENVRILDLVSKNGTYVNGKEIESLCW